MILFLEIVGGVILIILGSLCLPRLFIQATYNRTDARISLGNPLYFIRFDFNNMRLSISVWGIRISRTLDQLAGMLSKPAEEKTETDQPETPASRETVTLNRLILRMLWDEKGLLWDLTKIVAVGLYELYRAVRIDRFYINMTIATPDPSYTGVLYGVLQPFTLFNKPPDRMIIFTPDWMGEKISLDADIYVSVHPIRLMIIAVRTLRKLPVREMMRVYRVIRQEQAQSKA